MAKKIKPVDLTKAVNEVLKEYGDEVYTVLDDCVQEVTEESVKKLQSVRFNSKWGHPWDAYSKEWTSEKQSKGRLESKRVVYNEDKGRITHLLEYGHVFRNGGRADAKEHIAPVNNWANDELPRLVERKLG